MKKTLIAVAALSAMAASAMAADVTLYGRLDTGLLYTHSEDVLAESTSQFQMNSGFTTGSRWGIKGTEEIGSVKVGFTLESGFTSDNGRSAQDNRLFGRECVLTVGGDFGTFYFGRMGSVVSDAGSVSLLSATSVFGGAWGYATMKGTTGARMDRYDNSVAYVSPSLSGLSFNVMYSMKRNQLASGDEARENTVETDRYLAGGLKYANGPFTAVLTADYEMYAGNNVDEGYNIILGGNYKFSAATVYLKGAYFDNVRNALNTFDAFRTTDAKKGWGVELGTKIPAFGGDILAAVGYRNAENVNNSDDEYKFLTANVGYSYAFSKRTSLWSVIGYAQEKSEVADDTGKGFQVGVGLVHKF